MKFIIGAGYN